jgi:hypothetical protein
MSHFHLSRSNQSIVQWTSLQKQQQLGRFGLAWKPALHRNFHQDPRIVKYLIPFSDMVIHIEHDRYEKETSIPILLLLNQRCLKNVNAYSECIWLLTQEI